MKTLLTFFTILALAALAAPATCLATPPHPGPYFSGFVGLAIPKDTNSTSSTIDDRVEFDPGVNVGGTAGYDFGFIRMEGELSYKHGEISSVLDRNTGIRYSDVDGRIGALAMLGNIFLDLHTPGPITPYFGGGAGFAALTQSNTFGTDFTTRPGIRTQLYRSDSDAVFAYQAGAGLEIAINRRFSLDLAYRYFGTSKATFNSDSPDENRLRFESHNVSAGFRVRY